MLVSAQVPLVLTIGLWTLDLGLTIQNYFGYFTSYQMKSDFLTNEPKTIDGMVELYKNIGGYLGSKENGFENSVPKSVVLVPIQQVTKEINNHFFSYHSFSKLFYILSFVIQVKLLTKWICTLQEEEVTS